MRPHLATSGCDVAVAPCMRVEPSAMNDDDVLAAAARRADAGRVVAIATVVSTWGSSPCPAGSLLVVDDSGDFCGSVSGGCVEAAVIREALAVMADGKPRLLEFGVSDERALEVGLPCGGRLQVYVERLG